MEQSDLVWQHIQSAADVMDAGLLSMRQQLGEEAYKMASAAIKAGSMMQVNTTLSLAGTKALSLHLIAPNGETVTIARVEFADDDVTLN